MAKKPAWPTPIPVGLALERVGEDVAAWRKLQGLTAAQLASRAGITTRTLWNIEHGDGATFENVLRVARVIGLLDKLAGALDPYDTDVGRLRSDENLPQRVRSRRVTRDG